MIYGELQALGTPGTPFFKKLLREHLQSRTRGMNDAINAKYQGALRGLMSLDGLASIDRDGNSVLYANCKTKACVLKLSQDLQAWREFVDALNVTIDFKNFPKRHFINLARIKPTPVLSVAMASAAQTLLKGIKPNEPHTLGEVAVAIAQAPAGGVLGVLSAPVALFEKGVKGLRSILGLQYMWLELKAKRVSEELGPINRNQLIRYGAERAMDQRARTVYFDGEYEEVQRKEAEAAERAEKLKNWAALYVEVLTLSGHTGLLRSAAISPDGRSIVTASDDKTAKIYRLSEPDQS